MTAVCLVLGIAIIPVIVVLWVNIANLGVIAGFMIDAGRADVFYGLILPHGLLELTIIFVAAGAGLRLGWSWIAPARGPVRRPWPRRVARSGAIALGSAVWLLISGLVEGFVTPSTLPAWARMTIGATVWLAFLAYVFTLGRRAARAGDTGDVATRNWTRRAHRGRLILHPVPQRVLRRPMPTMSAARWSPWPRVSCGLTVSSGRLRRVQAREPTSRPAPPAVGSRRPASPHPRSTAPRARARRRTRPTPSGTGRPAGRYGGRDLRRHPPRPTWRRSAVRR